MNDFFIKDYNSLKEIPCSYLLMRGYDRFDDESYATEDEAVQAMEEAQEDGYEDMWVGYVEETGDGRTSVQFCCGAAE